MTNLEVALAGLSLLSLTALLAIIGKKTNRCRFLLFGFTCLTYLCVLMWQDPSSVNLRNTAIVVMAIIWSIFETVGEDSSPMEDNYGIKSYFFLKTVAIIFLGTAPILLVILDHERFELGLVEWIAIAMWSVGILLKRLKSPYQYMDFNRNGTYLLVWSYYIYALGAHDGMFAIFAPVLLLGKFFKAPEFFGAPAIRTEI